MHLNVCGHGNTYLGPSQSCVFNSEICMIGLTAPRVSWEVFQEAFFLLSSRDKRIIVTN
ncbi:hypothetical protein BDV27DRAFT_129930 [Aspergillus caelatus]|uniref:Uncharacterized protein n=1 Tax=Aspergillus caelatus TaxID=61420 RepID=A0A5N7A2K7_9EURO|nr:uncharacterized protein BDV27DRAFT_129930 [Aspergillus caelatus]KAE8363429.1 hypothetical protein BDV27DRAFT_129930 [Aspergillus caelatus]